MSSATEPIVHFQHRRWREAIDAADALLGDDPQHDNLWGLRGMALYELGDYHAAADALRRALALRSDVPAYHNNLGMILFKVGEFGASVDACKRAIELRNGYPTAWCNLGNALLAKELWRQAIEAYRSAINLKPDYAKAYANMGEALMHHGKLNLAEQSCRRAIQIQPAYPQALLNLGLVLSKRNDSQGAIAAFEKAIQSRPRYERAYGALVSLYHDSGDIGSAISVWRRFLNESPNDADIVRRIADLQHQMGDMDAARESYLHALALNPDLPEAHNNLGNLLRDSGEAEAALDAYERSWASRHHLEDADTSWNESNWSIDAPYRESGLRHNFALSRLQLGDFERGWMDHEYRITMESTETIPPDLLKLIPDPRSLKKYMYDCRDRRYARWNGESLEGKSILIWGEQGIGDEIMFGTMIPDIMAKASGVTIECIQRLVPLFKRSFPDAKVVVQSEPPLELKWPIDFHSPIGSLALQVRKSVDAFPRDNAYLKPDPSAVAVMRDRYRAMFGDRKLVGISWKTTNPKSAFLRNAPLDQWGDVLGVSNVQFINLQYGDVADEIQQVRENFGVSIHHDTQVDPLEDLDQFAAQISALDLVVSIDNSTVHVAGACGVPVWLLLPKGPDWRWTQGDDQSLWYPCMQLIRQTEVGKWSGPMGEVRERLALL